MRKLIFGGTTEGREAARQCAAAGDRVLVCVASEAGRRALGEGVECRVGQLDAGGMIALARSFGAEAIVDATHPFAKAVSENVRACAAATGLPLERIERPSDADADFAGDVTWADGPEAAAELLAAEEGNVFLATGSNTVDIYARALGPERLYARVLPDVRSLEKCFAAGLLPAHILAMQGPFSGELNAAVYEQWQIRHVVTKDSGGAGGVREKVLPALSMGIHVVMIRRPE